MRQPRITAADVAWDMVDGELIKFAFHLVRKNYAKSDMAEIVSNRCDGVERKALEGLADYEAKSYYGL